MPLYSDLLDKTDKRSRKRIERKKSLKDRKRSLVSEWLMKFAVSQITHKETETVIIERSSSGKPYLPDEDFYVNTSHSKDLVVCISDSVPVGIDIEYIRPVLSSIYKKILKDRRDPLSENQGKVEDRKDLIRFYKEWTKREAYLKLKDLPLSKVRDLDYRKDTQVHFKTLVYENYVITVCYIPEDI